MISKTEDKIGAIDINERVCLKIGGSVSKSSKLLVNYNPAIPNKEISNF